MPGFYFHDAWLGLYNFSKLRKLGVNLAVSNDRVLQMPVNYVSLSGEINRKDDHHIERDPACMSELLSPA